MSDTIESVAAKAAEEALPCKEWEWQCKRDRQKLASIISRYFAGWLEPEEAHKALTTGGWVFDATAPLKVEELKDKQEVLQQRLAQAEAERDAARADAAAMREKLKHREQEVETLARKVEWLLDRVRGMEAAIADIRQADAKCHAAMESGKGCEQALNELLQAVAQCVAAGGKP